jgi:hypothetical protein
MHYYYRDYGLICPHCGFPAERLPKRFLDRLAGLFHPVVRYRCLSLDCGCTGLVNPKQHMDKTARKLR